MQPRLEPHRFIPASAGNTVVEDSCIHIIPVHPRIRGEHCEFLGIDPAGDGSSPHPRGTRLRGHRTGRAPRFIPASAGNTPRRNRVSSRGPVHPRIRGEHASTPVMLIGVNGSSPHPRGTPSRGQWSGCNDRFIPASAGNTGRACSTMTRRSVHPRIRGEHVTSSTIAMILSGSSPHPRGTLLT